MRTTLTIAPRRCRLNPRMLSLDLRADQLAESALPVDGRSLHKFRLLFCPNIPGARKVQPCCFIWTPHSDGTEMLPVSLSK
jgi:hypothetical protein